MIVLIALGLLAILSGSCFIYEAFNNDNPYIGILGALLFGLGLLVILPK